MLRVIDIQDGTAVVSTDGLVQVRLHPGDEVVRELCEPQSADAFVRSFNSSGKDSWAEAIDYAEVRRRDLSPAPTG